MSVIWIVKYTRIPTAYNDAQNAKIEAETADDARTLLRDALGDGNGVHNYKIEEPVEYQPPIAKGRIISLNARGGDQ